MKLPSTVRPSLVRIITMRLAITSIAAILLQLTIVVGQGLLQRGRSQPQLRDAGSARLGQGRAAGASFSAAVLQGALHAAAVSRRAQRRVRFPHPDGGRCGRRRAQRGDADPAVAVAGAAVAHAGPVAGRSRPGAQALRRRRIAAQDRRQGGVDRGGHARRSGPRVSGHRRRRGAGRCLDADDPRRGPDLGRRRHLQPAFPRGPGARRHAGGRNVPARSHQALRRIGNAARGCDLCQRHQRASRPGGEPGEGAAHVHRPRRARTEDAAGGDDARARPGGAAHQEPSGRRARHERYGRPPADAGASREHRATRDQRTRSRPHRHGTGGPPEGLGIAHRA